MCKKLFVAVLLCAWSLCGWTQNQQQRLEKHLYYLASDEMRGRKAGSEDGRKAAEYVEKEYRQMGLAPLFDSYRQYFVLDTDAVMSILSMQTKTKTVPADSLGCYGVVFCNIVAVIEGSDPVLKDEYIVLGGHYDHLGVKNGEVYNGADDNASGTAAVIEVARQLMQHRAELKRSVIICAFDAEEMGLFGSKALAGKIMQADMADKVKMMMSIDMVGWLEKGRHLSLTGTGTLHGCADLLNEVAKQVNIPIATTRFESSPFTATDTEPFARLGIPTLAVTTGLKSPYHKPGDDPELIDYAGLSKVADYLAALTLRMADGVQPMESTGRVAAKFKDRRKLFEVGVVAGYNSTNLEMDESAFNCKNGFSLTAGLSADINFSRYVGLEIDALYDRTKMPYPDMADLLGSSLEYRQQSLLVPVQLRALLGNASISVNIGIGGFYGYRFTGNMRRNDVRLGNFGSQHQYGFVWSIEERMANLSFDFSFYTQFQPLAVGTTFQLPVETRTHFFTFTLGWYF